MPIRPMEPALEASHVDWYVLDINSADPHLAAGGIRIFVAPAQSNSQFSSSQFRFLTSAPLNGYWIVERKV